MQDDFSDEVTMNDKNSFTPPFRGVATALATPFLDGKVDLLAFRRQIAYQQAAGIDALVVCGTTGEAPTLRRAEKERLIATAVETAGGRGCIVAGTGSADTREAIGAAKRAAALGANALLVVTPFYNRGTSEGIVAHYLRIADATDLPIILYNVPSRTGVNLTLPQLKQLVCHPNIRGIKEASGSIDAAADILSAFGERLAVYSGNDSQTLPLLSLGGHGVISVVSNLYPAMMKEAVRLFEAGRNEESRALMLRLLPMIRLLFAETNPAPLKAAMQICERDSGELRLPLAEVPYELRSRLRAALAALPS